MQGTARAAAGCNGEVLLAQLDAFLLVGACNRMLETSRVGGVASDGNVNALVMHDSNALAHVVCAEAANLGALAVRVSDFLDDVQLAGVVIKLGLYVGKAVDAGDDLCSVLAQAVQDNAQRLLACLVRGASQTDSAFSSSEGLVASQECEALGLLAQQHSCQIAVTQTYLAVISNRARDAECLQADADCLSSLRCGLYALLDCDCSAYGVSPASVLKCDRLYGTNGCSRINALFLADFSTFLYAGNAVLSEDAIDLVNSSFVTFKQSHDTLSSLLCTRVDELHTFSKAAVGAGVLSHSLRRLNALADLFHHLAQMNELIADDQIVLVQSQTGNIALSR